MYYDVKLQWLQPKDGTDEMEKKKKTFIVNALSCMEAEGKILKWIPSNYQDAVVKGTTESKIVDLKMDNESEDWWEVVMADENEKGKLIPFIVVINGTNHLEVLKRINTLYSTSEFESIKKYKKIVDDDLISSLPITSIVKKDNIVNASIEDDD